jgi:hypothetical protein
MIGAPGHHTKTASPFGGAFLYPKDYNIEITLTNLENTMKAKNLTAKHAPKFNKAAVHKDRKKAEKRGEQKHKSRSDDRLFTGQKTSTKSTD